MSKEFVLRKKPKFVIVLNDTEFEINNKGIKEFNGKYKYVNLNAIKFKKERINWLYLILDIFLSFIFKSSASSIIKDKNKISLTYNHKIIEIKRYNTDVKDCKRYC